MEQIEKEKIQSNKGSSYKLLVEQAKLKQATSKVSGSSSSVVFEVCSTLGYQLPSSDEFLKSDTSVAALGTVNVLLMDLRRVHSVLV